MYCRKCGKQIDYDAPICKECEEAETFFGDPTPEQPVQPVQTVQIPEPVGDRKEGFSGALTATIMGAVAFLISAFAFGFTYGSLEVLMDYGYIEGDLINIGLFMAFIGLGLAIPGMILGIKGMKCFFRAKREGRIKPIATLVCGIIGLATSAMTYLYVLLSIIMYMAALPLA